jgi:hypothetical protein
MNLTHHFGATWKIKALLIVHYYFGNPNKINSIIKKVPLHRTVLIQSIQMLQGSNHKSIMRIQIQYSKVIVTHNLMRK